MTTTWLQSPTNWLSSDTDACGRQRCRLSLFLSRSGSAEGVRNNTGQRSQALAGGAATAAYFRHVPSILPWNTSPDE